MRIVHTSAQNIIILIFSIKMVLESESYIDVCLISLTTQNFVNNLERSNISIAHVIQYLSGNKENVPTFLTNTSYQFFNFDVFMMVCKFMWIIKNVTLCEKRGRLVCLLCCTNLNRYAYLWSGSCKFQTE